MGYLAYSVLVFLVLLAIAEWRRPGRRFSVGTRSLLFGVHQFAIHPATVAIAWRRARGSWPRDPRIWIAFVVHDWGYWGCETMDGEDGKRHPEAGAAIMGRLFGDRWRHFCLYHSRSYARRAGVEPSPLCAPDKLAFLVYPRWLYLALAKASGELWEYMRNARTQVAIEVGIDASTPESWYDTLCGHMTRVSEKLEGGRDAGVPAEDVEQLRATIEGDEREVFIENAPEIRPPDSWRTHRFDAVPLLLGQDNPRALKKPEIVRRALDGPLALLRSDYEHRDPLEMIEALEMFLRIYASRRNWRSSPGEPPNFLRRGYDLDFYPSSMAHGYRFAEEALEALERFRERQGAT